jgi:exodeoxyribonuclease-3
MLPLSIDEKEASVRTLKLASWNVNGIRAIHKKGFLQFLEEEQPDVLGLQEIKIMADQLTPEIIKPPGYHTFFCHAERKGYSGTAIYTKNLPISIQRGFGHARFDQEGRTIIADFGDFVFLNSYYPNGKMNEERLQYKLDFYDHFLHYVEDLLKQGKKLIICGDFNTAHKPIDLSHPKRNEDVSGFLPQERAWMDRLVSRGFVDSFRQFDTRPEQYTWWHMVTNARARNVGWRIDYFFHSENMQSMIEGATIKPDVFGSDHCPITLSLSI